jgi:hypothetical protein
MLREGRAVWLCSCLVLWATGCCFCGKCSKCADPEERTGHPYDVAKWAVPSDTGKYIGYEVGGGCAHPCKGEAPSPDEGTWGWDYEGCLLPSRIALDWWHGRRYQDGIGDYRTDGPRPAEKIERRHEDCGHGGAGDNHE